MADGQPVTSGHIPVEGRDQADRGTPLGDGYRRGSSRTGDPQPDVVGQRQGEGLVRLDHGAYER
jgi:hypothetical protein